jgi:tetratricopeptide (TPR) repeat protein
MSEYNNSVNDANAYNKSIGINSSLNKVDLGMIPGVTVSYDFNSFLGSLGIYINNDLIILKDTTSEAKWENNTLAQSIRNDFSVFCSTLGLRYNITSESIPSLSGYAGAGAGFCHYYWNTMAEEAYKIDGGSLYKIQKNWNTAIPVFEMECGLNWWLGSSMGLGIKGGYRISQGKVMVRTTNILGWSGPEQAEDNVDYTGFFAGAGVLLKFDAASDGGKNVQNSGKGGQFPEIAGRLYMEAEALYDDGMYRQAREKILEAVNAAPESVMINELKENIDLKLKDVNSADEVKKMLKDADGLRRKNEMKKARMKYAEVLDIDAGNESAVYFTGYFDSQAKELFTAAKALRAEGRLKEAVESAKQAAEYVNDDATIRDFIRETGAMLDKDGEIKKLYNEGVDNYRKGEYKKAYDLWAEVVKLKPGDTEAAKNMEKAKKRTAESGDGEKEAVKKALEEAKTLFAIGNMDEASKKCGYALRLDPENEEALKLKADIEKAQNSGTADAPEKR